ncbi:MAG: NAD(P)-dependent alcohol dehydrogenase [Bacteroidia bacterium]|nr:NAD(P)-dependent alcohol dehydrogenase [Bacteroidia bacterium]
MKASIFTQYGAPSVLQIKDVTKPTPKETEVLVKIHATTVNRTDCGFRSAEYFIVRLMNGLFGPKKQILGTEFSGEIEAIGKSVTSFKVGDQVFGLNTFKFSTHAEYVCIPENKSIALKPNNMSYEEAAAVCDGLMLAINYVGKIDFKTNPNIIINGTSGSIGSAALQLAKYYGAKHITAVCNTKNIALMKTLGADEVIDYTKEDFTKSNLIFDVVLDAVGKSTFFKCKSILKKGGVYYSSELGPNGQNIFLTLLTPIFSSRKVKFPIPTDSKKDIEFFKKIIEEGKYKAIIDKTYSLSQIVEATTYVETGEKTGNVVIKVI